MLSAGCFYSVVSIAPAKQGAGEGGGREDAGCQEPGHGACPWQGPAWGVFWGLLLSHQSCRVRHVLSSARPRERGPSCTFGECPCRQRPAASLAWRLQRGAGWGCVSSSSARSRAKLLTWPGFLGSAREVVASLHKEAASWERRSGGPAVVP